MTAHALSYTHPTTAAARTAVMADRYANPNY